LALSLKPCAARALNLLDCTGLWIGLLVLRVLVGWEFFEAGWTKLGGENWFADVQDKFPFPFNLVPAEVSWQLAVWFEILGGIALMIGLGTRFFSVSLIVLTVVAILSVHWPAEWNTLAELWKGYVLTDEGQGNYKLPLIFIAMLIPLALSGPGKLSIDAWIRKQYLGKA
jgi:putative oxidoreductase